MTTPVVDTSTWLPRRWQADPGEDSPETWQIWRAEARAWLAAHPKGLPARQIDDAVLVLDELVLDALFAGRRDEGGPRGVIRASVEVDVAGRVRVEVSAGPLHDGPMSPWTMRIVGALVVRWAIDPTQPRRRRVWAIVPRVPARRTAPRGGTR